MTRGTFEALGREVQATGRVPQQHAFGRPPVPLDKQVLAFAWFIANSKAIRSVSDRFDVSSRHISLPKIWPGTGKNLCEIRKKNTQFHRKISNGKTGLLFHKFHFSGNFPVEQSEKSCSIYLTQPEFPKSLGKWKTPSVSPYKASSTNALF